MAELGVVVVNIFRGVRQRLVGRRHSWWGWWAGSRSTARVPWSDPLRSDAKWGKRFDREFPRKWRNSFAGKNAFGHSPCLSLLGHRERERERERERDYNLYSVWNCEKALGFVFESMELRHLNVVIVVPCFNLFVPKNLAVWNDILRKGFIINYFWKYFFRN